MVLLEKGPEWTAEVTPELEALQARHLAHLDAAWQAGQAEVCGPADDPDARVRGFCLYATTTAKAAREVAEQDPMVRAGHLSVRVLPWWTQAGFLAFPHSTLHAAPGHGPPARTHHGPRSDGRHGPPRAETGPHGAPTGHGDHATVHHRFDDVDKWTGVFDDPARLEWQKPDAVVEVLALEKRMSVADIGAGTGFFNPYLDAAVGKRGRVIPVDVERSLVDHMVARAEREGTPSVQPRLGRFEDPGLLPGEVDRILMVDTYHHISERRDYFRRLLPALKPGGRMVIVDFKPGDLPVGPRAGHKLPVSQVVDELTEAGWRLESQADPLPYQYVLAFVPAEPGRP